jgi:hypothetical protein
MRRDDEMDRTLDDRIDGALRGGVTSTPEARARVMAAVRVSARPVRGVGDIRDLAAGAVPLRASRPLWRSPAIGLLAAASIAGIIALVRAVSVDGPIPDIPGQPIAHRARTGQPRVETVAPAASGPSTATISGTHTRVAKVQFVLVAPEAHRVVVVGDFNDWDPSAAPLAGTSGVWSGEVDVPFGRHDYAFVVDGERWVRDPSAPRAPADEFGNGYSVLVVGEHLGEHR